MEEVSEILRGKCVQRFVGEDEKFEGYPIFDGEPVQLFKDKGDVLPGFGAVNM